jgi:prevent-host-death family protein
MALMRTVNIHEAKTHLSQLIEKVIAGEDVIIAKAGKPLVRLTALEPPPRKSRIGFLKGQITVPDDFDTMFQDEIEEMFYGSAEETKK